MDNLDREAVVAGKRDVVHLLVKEVNKKVKLETINARARTSSLKSESPARLERCGESRGDRKGLIKKRQVSGRRAQHALTTWVV